MEYEVIEVEAKEIVMDPEPETVTQTEKGKRYNSITKRDEIVEWALMLIGEGATRNYVRNSLRDNFGVKDGRSFTTIWNSAINHLHNAEVAEKSAVLLLAKLDRIYEQAMDNKKLAQAVAAIETQVKILGLNKSEVAPLTKIEINY